MYLHLMLVKAVAGCPITHYISCRYQRRRVLSLTPKLYPHAHSTPPCQRLLSSRFRTFISVIVLTHKTLSQIVIHRGPSYRNHEHRTMEIAFELTIHAITITFSPFFPPLVVYLMNGSPVPTFFLYTSYFSPKNSTRAFSSTLILLEKNNHNIPAKATVPNLFPSITCVPNAQ